MRYLVWRGLVQAKDGNRYQGKVHRRLCGIQHNVLQNKTEKGKNKKTIQNDERPMICTTETAVYTYSRSPSYTYSRSPSLIPRT